MKRILLAEFFLIVICIVSCFYTVSLEEKENAQLKTVNEYIQDLRTEKEKTEGQMEDLTQKIDAFRTSEAFKELELWTQMKEKLEESLDR